MHEARYYDKADEERVQCRLCPHFCRIAPGKRGICGVRENRGGTLAAMSYARLTSIAMDPVEKKPLYHFHPGSPILSVGSFSCNFHCDFCQNYSISQEEAPSQEVGPDRLAEMAEEERSIGIAYTYNEPSIWHEYVCDAARAAVARGLVNVLVTNGFFNPEPLDELLEVVDALNIDIKSMDDDFYKRLCGGRLEPVLRSAEAAAKKAHVEITHLVIPGENDSPDQFERLAAWTADHLGPDTPVHLSAYFPRYKLKRPATDHDVLSRAREALARKMRYVYLGNVAARDGSDTRCAGCGAVLVERSGYSVRLRSLGADGACSKCGARANFVVA
jgi:pyruvate formate lyase activating enzyme